MMDRRHFTLGLGAVAGTAALAASLPARAAGKLKCAWIYVGPVGDEGYSYQHDLGRKAVEQKLGDKVQTSFVESVPEGADCERVLTQLANDGNELIFATSFGFMNPVIKVAQRFPNVKFEHATGYKRAKNVATYSGRFYEGRTPLGTIAGRLTKSNIIGYIASVPIPEVVGGIDAFTLALKKVNPKAEVRVEWVMDWYNPGKEADAAKALMDQGADILTQHTDSPAAIQAAEQRGIWCFGQSSDMSRFGPKHCATSIVENWSLYYPDRVQLVLDGKWTSTDTWDGLKSGMVELAPLNPGLPDDVRKEAEQVIADIKSGKRLPFAGPMKDQTGKITVADGQSLPDKDILSIGYYVEGVQGALPK